jgi:hypothetical protein
MIAPEFKLPEKYSILSAGIKKHIKQPAIIKGELKYNGTSSEEKICKSPPG